MIRRKIPWTSQPQYPVGIDRSDPIIASATDVYSGSTHRFNAATNRLESVSAVGSGYSIQEGTRGVGIVTPNGGWADYALNRDWQGSNTVIMLCRIRSMDTQWGGLWAKNSSGTFAQFVVGRHNTNDSLYAAVNNDATYNVAYPISGSSINALLNVDNVLAFVFDSTTTIVSFYVNGVYVGATASTGSMVSGTGPLGLGRSADNSATYDSDTTFYYFTRIPKALNADQVKKLSQNVWASYTPQERKILVSGASGGAALAGNATDTAAATGALSTSIQVAGAAVDTATSTGSLSTGIPLAGIAASVSTASGALTAQIKFDAAALASVLATGDLGTGINLAGTAADVSTSTGSITTQITLSGAAVAEALATAALTTSPQGLSGNAVAVSSASGALTTQVQMAGAASAISTSTAGLITGIQLAGASASVSHATGDLTISLSLTAAALAQAAANGNLSTMVQLSAQSLAQALATGILSVGSDVPQWGANSMYDVIIVMDEDRVIRVPTESRMILVPL